MGARMKVRSSMRFTPGYLACRFFTAATVGGTHCSTLS